MFILAIIPTGLKMKAAKKYYDFAARYEINDLHRIGIHGVRVVMYGTSLDCPGRKELLAMQSVQAFYPCHVCMQSHVATRAKQDDLWRISALLA